MSVPVPRPATGLAYWTPRADQTGVQAVLVRVRDNHGGVTMQAFSVTVSGANNAPVFTSQPQGPATATKPWQYQLQRAVRLSPGACPRPSIRPSPAQRRSRVCSRAARAARGG